ncbi:hypothetical protein SAMN02745181_0385 [Rubritalea squalenifaciens DSM 18772]|uniref:Lipoprotein n=1 Tax=Rubritalea squalenifaciens DSM 18772 TaxID=1123071 RepID=A0A1M6C4N7_9BACT|nr:hypothetical protein [Rubritalea squalenifaciens]SHI55903.1 hypothetical protein SAMN02745181_0385 [Rubritalea squalenifaciens DSM 18772]
MRFKSFLLLLLCTLLCACGEKTQPLTPVQEVGLYSFLFDDCPFMVMESEVEEMSIRGADNKHESKLSLGVRGKIILGDPLGSVCHHITDSFVDSGYTITQNLSDSKGDKLIMKGTHGTESFVMELVVIEKESLLNLFHFKIRYTEE